MKRAYTPPSERPAPPFGQLGEVLSTILFFAFMLAIVFLFHGEPSLWDLLHARAMEALKP